MTPSVLIDRGTVAASSRREEPEAGANPRTRRFLVNPGLRGFEVHPKLSGRQLAVIPPGVPVRFDTFVGMKVRNWSVDAADHSPPDTERDLTAGEAVKNVLVSSWESSRDTGVRELSALTPLADDEAERLLALVFPQPDPAKCPYDDENTSEMEGGAEVFRCVTCSLEWLESPGCESAAASGGAAGKFLRKELLDAYRTAHKYFVAKWSEILTDMEKRQNREPGIATLNDAHLHVMRQVHEIRPSDRQAAIIGENNRQQADAFKEGIREVLTEMRAPQQPAPPAFDMEAIIAAATERAKAQLRAEMEAEKEQAKPGRGGK